MTTSRTRPLLVLTVGLALAVAAACSDEQRRDLGGEDVRSELHDRTVELVENEGLEIDGDLDCSADIGDDAALTASCAGTTTSAAAVSSSFTGTADVDAETCTAQLVVEIDGETVLDEAGVDCFASS